MEATKNQVKRALRWKRIIVNRVFDNNPVRILSELFLLAGKLGPRSGHNDTVIPLSRESNGWSAAVWEEGNNRAPPRDDKLGNRRPDRNAASRTAACKVSRRPIN